MTTDFPHYRVINGNGYWIATPNMKQMGFQCVPCGRDGHEARATALRWEQRYQDARRGITTNAYPAGTVGWAFQEIRNLEGWKRKPAATRQEWERGWQFIEGFFADIPPRKITRQLLDRWYYAILDKHGVDAAWRAIKIWRVLYNEMASMNLCEPGRDPSLRIQRLQQQPRTGRWADGEVARLIKQAVRYRMLALACIISIAWDTIFQPGDLRTLVRTELFRTSTDWVIHRSRLKTGEDLMGTLKRRSRRLLECYLKSLNCTLQPEDLAFRTKGYAAGSKGGRPRPPSPYTKNKLANDFRIVREAVFGKGDGRVLMDMRRSGAMEAIAGDASSEHLAQTLANRFDTSKKLQQTYAPNHLSSVRKTDAARKKGRREMAEAKNQLWPLQFDWEGDEGAGG